MATMIPKMMNELSKFWTIEKHNLMMMATATTAPGAVRASVATLLGALLLASVWPLLRAYQIFAPPCATVYDTCQLPISYLFYSLSIVLLHIFDRLLIDRR
jgi:hypothetical protein